MARRTPQSQSYPIRASGTERSNSSTTNHCRHKWLRVLVSAGHPHRLPVAAITNTTFVTTVSGTDLPILESTAALAASSPARDGTSEGSSGEDCPFAGYPLAFRAGHSRLRAWSALMGRSSEIRLLWRFTSTQPFSHFIAASQGPVIDTPSAIGPRAAARALDCSAPGR